MIIVITTAITYTTFSMNQITQLAETIQIKQNDDFKRTTESFDVVNISIDNNQFNMTVKNTGDLPIHLNRLWVENTTDSSWPISKYDIDYSLAPGNTTTNIGQDIGLSVLDTQSYYAQLISDRGNQNQVFVNSVGESPLFLRLTATPAVMPTTFQTTVTLEVINTGNTQLLNLQPNMISITPTCTDSCQYVEEQSVMPVSFGNLSPGDTAIFEWVYSFTGSNGDLIVFEAGLVNDVETDTVTVALQTIESSLNAEVAIESGGLGDQEILGKDILIFHEELTSFDEGNAYQMYSGAADGGGNGDRIQLDQETPHFVTKNGTANVVPAGDWELALMLSSEPVGDDVDNNYDLIYHFEDGVDPIWVENSEDSATGASDDRNLEACGATPYFQEITDGDNDSDERVSTGDTNVGSPDIELGYEGDVGYGEYMGAMRFTGINVNSGTLVNSAFIQFQADKSNGNNVNVRFQARAVDNADDFSPDQNSRISNYALTTAYVDWSPAAWTPNQHDAGTTTPDLSSIIQEVINREGWSSGNAITIVISDNGSTVDHYREAEAEDSGDNPAPQLTINWDDTATPLWQDNSGPHNSGSYYFDGNNDCFRSSNGMTGGDGNSLEDRDNTTSLWFKTADNDLAISEDMYLVNFEDNNDDEHYRIFLTAGAAGSDGGKVAFTFADESDSDLTTCETLNDYDDNQWHHVTAIRDASDDECWLQIMDLDGTEPEIERHSNPNYDGDEDLELDGNRWNIGSNEGQDGNFFKGWIDDVFHWDNTLLSDGDRDDHARTNFGEGAHQFNLYVDLTDEDGVFKSNLFTSGTPIEASFADPMDGGDNDDFAYTQVNMTMSLPEVTLLDTERLDVYFTWQSPTATWEALEVDMKIDDTDMTTPYPSFMKIPEPDEWFPTYYEFNPNDEFQIFVANTGEDGIFLTYQGTRVNFNGTMGSYAGLIHQINDTNMDEDHDSLHIPPGFLGKLEFHEATNIPSDDETGTLMVDGRYDTTVWINGYSDQGETFSRSVVVGSVEVITP